MRPPAGVQRLFGQPSAGAMALRARAGVLLLALFALGAGARAAASEVVVRFRAAGPHALRECAETLAAEGRSFAPWTADGSDSLDRLLARVEARRVRALFRRPDARPFALQRRALRERFEAARRSVRRPPSASIPDLSHVYLAEIPPEIGAASAVSLLRSDPHVLYAQPNYAVEADFTPDDPFFFSSGSWGQPYRDLWGLQRIAVEPAWERALGSGVVVAVVDSGVDYTHPDLVDNIWVNPGEDLDGNGRVDPGDVNGVDDDGNGFVDDLRGFDFANSRDANADGDFGDRRDRQDADPFDDYGHGTHVAGTIAAVGENGTGIIGVAPRARIMAVKGLNARGSGSIATLAKGVVYAAANGARVINGSWSCSTRCPSNPVIEDAAQLVHALGAALVLSAGNKSDEVDFYSPQNLRETLAVAASNPSDGIASFSNVGFAVDLAAPGAGLPVPPPSLSPERGILSLLSAQASSALDGGGALVVGADYLRLSGTSMSAPHVAGVAALLLSQRPSLSVDQVLTALRLSADDIGRPGHDRASGAGRVDAARALALDPIPDVHAALSSPERNSVLEPGEQAVEIRGSAAGADFAGYSLVAGFGVDPAVWTPLGPEVSTPVVEGVLGTWEVSELAEGAWVLRLVVRERGGGTLEEFRTVTLERNPPTALSSPDVDATAPDISGELVVWQSPSEAENDGLDLVLHDLSDGSERPIAAGPGDQREAAISGDLIAWQDTRRFADYEIYSCLYQRDRGLCRERRVSVGLSSSRTGPVAAEGRRLVWSDQRAQAPSNLFLCHVRPNGGACREHVVVSDPLDPFEADLDGDRLVWLDFSQRGRADLFTCALDPQTDACPARQVPTGALFHFNPAVAGNLVAWNVIFDLHMCELDPLSGGCAPRLLTDREPGRAVLSGQRIAWHEVSTGGDLDLFFCEWDPVRRICPKQRLSAHPADQREPALDGDRIVWEDLREGSPRIFLFELPSIDAGSDRTLRAGEELVIDVVGRDPLHGQLELEARLADGRALASVGASFTQLEPQRGVFVWRPTPEQVGSYAFTFSGRTAGRLETYETIRVGVLAQE